MLEETMVITTTTPVVVISVVVVVVVAAGHTEGGGIKTSHPEDQVFVNTWSLFLLIVNQDFIKVTSLVLNKKKLCQLQKVIFLLQFLLRLSIEILRNRPLEFSNIEKM